MTSGHYRWTDIVNMPSHAIVMFLDGKNSHPCFVAIAIGKQYFIIIIIHDHHKNKSYHL